MTLKIIALGAAVALAAGAAAVAAADQPGQRTEERVVIVGGPGPHGDMDANRDGAVTRDEFRAMHDRMFDKLDKDRDGKISDGEFRDHHGAGEFNIRVDGPRGHGPGDVVIMDRHGPPGTWTERAPGPGGPNEDVRIVRRGPGDGRGELDANNDGKLSFDEFVKPMREHFTEADKNRNGFLDKDEMEGRDHVFMFRRMERRE